MVKIGEIIRQKPQLFLVSSLAYLLVVGLFKWQLKPPLGALWYLAGGTVGIYFLDVAEVFFNLTPSPFRSVVFAASFALVAFFVVTSSGSLLATGLVLAIYLTILLWQVGEWRALGNLGSWYQLVATPVQRSTQRWILAGFIGLFLIQTFLFIRSP